MKEPKLITNFFDEDDEANRVLAKNVHHEFKRNVIDKEDHESESSESCDGVYFKQNHLEPEICVPSSSLETKEELACYHLKLAILSMMIIFVMVSILFVGPSIDVGLINRKILSSKDIDTDEYDNDYLHNKNEKRENQKAGEWSKEDMSKSFEKEIVLKNNHHPFLLEDINIPIFLDFPGTSNRGFTTALFECLGVKSVPVQVYMNDLHKNKSLSYDFLTLKSLCGWHQPYLRKLKFFFLIENPVLRLVENYELRHDKAYFHFNSFNEYLNWSSSVPKNNNVLIRSILCKKYDDDVSTKDFGYAKAFLSEKVFIGDFQDYNSTTSMFQQKFRWKTKKVSSSTFTSVSSCMDGYLRKDNINRGRLLVDNSQYLEPEKLQKIYEAHFYDMSIYRNYIKDK